MYQIKPHPVSPSEEMQKELAQARNENKKYQVGDIVSFNVFDKYLKNFSTKEIITFRELKKLELTGKIEKSDFGYSGGFSDFIDDTFQRIQYRTIVGLIHDFPKLLFDEKLKTIPSGIHLLNYPEDTNEMSFITNDGVKHTFSSYTPDQIRKNKTETKYPQAIHWNIQPSDFITLSAIDSFYYSKNDVWSNYLICVQVNDEYYFIKSQYIL